MAIEIISTLTVADMEANPDIMGLIAEYADECSIDGLPPFIDKVTGYKAIEATGMFKLFCAFDDDKLIGFITVITPHILHYGAMIATAESLFVGKDHRHTGAGLKLIRAAQDHAKDAGSPGMLFSAPSGGQLAKVMPSLGYRETNTTFYKGFDDVDHA